MEAIPQFAPLPRRSHMMSRACWRAMRDALATANAILAQGLPLAARWPAFVTGLPAPTLAHAVQGLPIFCTDDAQEFGPLLCYVASLGEALAHPDPAAWLDMGTAEAMAGSYASVGALLLLEMAQRLHLVDVTPLGPPTTDPLFCFRAIGAPEPTP